MGIIIYTTQILAKIDYFWHILDKTNGLYMADEISNLPQKSHSDYAQASQIREKGGPEQQKGSPVAAINVTIPSPSNIETFLGGIGNTIDEFVGEVGQRPWAIFPTPPHGFVEKFERSKCFSQDVIAPSLGSQEQLQNLKTKLEAMGNMPFKKEDHR